MKVRIVKTPTGIIQGVDLSHYHVGHTYDLPSNLANYLVAEGYAEFEMRQDPNRPGAR